MLREDDPLSNMVRIASNYSLADHEVEEITSFIRDPANLDRALASAVSQVYAATGSSASIHAYVAVISTAIGKAIENEVDAPIDTAFVIKIIASAMYWAYADKRVNVG